MNPVSSNMWSKEKERDVRKEGSGVQITGIAVTRDSLFVCDRRGKTSMIQVSPAMALLSIIPISARSISHDTLSRIMSK